jgi:hypothetical protein
VLAPAAAVAAAAAATATADICCTVVARLSQYYSAILFTLVVIYTLLTVGANLVFLWLDEYKLRAAAAAAAEPQQWQPQDMMHFLCKVRSSCAVLWKFCVACTRVLIVGGWWECSHITEVCVSGLPSALRSLHSLTRA